MATEKLSEVVPNSPKLIIKTDDTVPKIVIKFEDKKPNIVIKEGLKGDKGDKGDQGLQGPVGIPGVVVAETDPQTGQIWIEPTSEADMTYTKSEIEGLINKAFDSMVNAEEVRY